MKAARVIRGRLMSTRVEALLYAVAANVKTKRRKLREGVYLQGVDDGSLCLFRPDGGDAFDGWRPRTKRDCVIVRAIDLRAYRGRAAVDSPLHVRCATHLRSARHRGRQGGRE